MSTSVKRMSIFINKKNQIKIEIIFYLLQKSERKKKKKKSERDVKMVKNKNFYK